MKHIWLIFIICAATLAALVWRKPEPNIFADGHIVNLPLPAPFVRKAPPLEEFPAALLATLAPPQAPAPLAAAKLVLTEPEPGIEQMLSNRSTDQSDWGISRLPIVPPVIIASVPPPQTIQTEPPPPAQVQPATETSTIQPATDVQASIPAIITPNLYLPEGALTDEEANLTLIKADLQAYEQPDANTTSAPFMLREGEQIRPLTRIRSAGDFDWLRFERDGHSWWAKAEYFIRIDPRNLSGLYGAGLSIGTEEVGKNSALPPAYKPSDLVAIPAQHNINGKEIRLRKEAAEALEHMTAAAAKKDLTLKAFSGYRDFDHQKKLYIEAIDQHGPKQNGVAEPGYSEHQLGTTVDLTNRDTRYIMSEAFGQTPEGQWLKENAEKFGFRFSYTRENSSESGYKSEPWHLRYLGAPPDETKSALAQK
ncbi:MAG: M15 family metallopeptidase [bacterium]|nr:M15 family metallopeptidase [Candidatus Sumerlaeota bacterium]